jgi:hypothetical protein
MQAQTTKIVLAIRLMMPHIGGLVAIGAALYLMVEISRVSNWRCIFAMSV